MEKSNVEVIPCGKIPHHGSMAVIGVSSWAEWSTYWTEVARALLKRLWERCDNAIWTRSRMTAPGWKLPVRQLEVNIRLRCIADVGVADLNYLPGSI